MPRSDPSFTDADLLRFYCKNLNPSEKYLVLKRFNDFLSKGTKICPDDPDERIDPCEWIAFARKLVAESADLAKILSKFVLVIAALEVALGALSWVGPAAKILRIIIIVLGYIEAVLFFVTAILLLISELDPFLRFLQAFFCTGEKPLPLPKPPDINLPENPNRRMDEIVDWVNGVFDWLSPSESAELPPDVMTGP